jgi:hypothetical protein
MRFVVGALAATGLLCACATPAAVEGGAKPAETGVKVADTGEKKICKRTPVMGSNMPQRVCSTQAEWDVYDKAGQKTVEDFDRSRAALGTPTDGERPNGNN